MEYMTKDFESIAEAELAGDRETGTGTEIETETLSEPEPTPPPALDIPVLEDAVFGEQIELSSEFHDELPLDGTVVEALLSLPVDEDSDNADRNLSVSASELAAESAADAGGDSGDDDGLSEEDRQQIEMLEAFANAEALEEISESMAETIFGDGAADDLSASLRETFANLIGPETSNPDESGAGSEPRTHGGIARAVGR